MAIQYIKPTWTEVLLQICKFFLYKSIVIQPFFQNQAYQLASASNKSAFATFTQKSAKKWDFIFHIYFLTETHQIRVLSVRLTDKQIKKEMSIYLRTRSLYNRGQFLKSSVGANTWDQQKRSLMRKERHRFYSFHLFFINETKTAHLAPSHGKANFKINSSLFLLYHI